MAITDLGYQELRNLIRRQVREVRMAANLTQHQLAAELGVSRFKIMRLEAGSQELHLDQALAIGRVTGDGSLADLVEVRDQHAEARSGAPSRDLEVRNLLERPGIHRVDVSLVDDLRLHEFVMRNPALDNAQVTVVIPTTAREEQLFGDKLLSGHYEHEVKRLTEVADPSAKVIESTRVLQPAIVVRSSTGDACATWPTMITADRIYGRDAPVVTTQDHAVVEELSDHLRAITADDVARTIYKNEALGVLGDLDNDGVRRIRFVGYAPHGVDVVADGIAGGLAVSLIIIHGVIARDGYPPRRRYLLYRRESVKFDSGRWSLLSNPLDDIDIRQGMSDGRVQEDLWRSPDECDAAAERDAVRFGEFEIPDAAFRLAAVREFGTRFGFEVAPKRLELLHLPGRLAQIDKGANQWPLLPRVYAYELLRDADGIKQLKEIRDSDVDIEPFGLDDLPTAESGTREFNDFLVRAAADGWFRGELERLGVAAK